MDTTKQEKMTTSALPTRNRGKEIFTYIFKVLEIEDDSPIIQAFKLEGRTDINSLLELEPQDLEDLQYYKNGVPTAVPKFQLLRIRTLFGYIAYRKLQHNEIGVDWTSVTVDELNQYRISPHFRCHTSKTLPPELNAYPASQVDP